MTQIKIFLSVSKNFYNIDFFYGNIQTQLLIQIQILLLLINSYMFHDSIFVIPFERRNNDADDRCQQEDCTN